MPTFKRAQGSVQGFKRGGALGIRYMSNPNAEVMGILGSGGMARTFAMTAKAVRPIRRIQVYSPNRVHLEAYCDEMRSKLGIAVVPVESAKAAVKDADIVSGCTNSMEAVITPDLVRPGVHITNVMLWEVSSEAYATIDAVGVLVRRTPMSVAGFVDDDFGMRMGVLSYAGGQPHERMQIPTPERREGRYPNARIVDCCDWQTNQPYQRSRPDEITSLATASHGTLEGEGGGSAGIQASNRTLYRGRWSMACAAE